MRNLDVMRDVWETSPAWTVATQHAKRGFFMWWAGDHETMTVYQLHGV